MKAKLELTKEEAIELIEEALTSRGFDIERGSVSFVIGEEYRGYGPMETPTKVLKNITARINVK